MSITAFTIASLIVVYIMVYILIGFHEEEWGFETVVHALAAEILMVLFVLFLYGAIYGIGWVLTNAFGV